ncbi:hypothetical protein E6H37_01795 [Candidatus Bathyarchaeota archaeon]|nr:MAG: hypothetical protein E6H37_01795 [Candidatus Bathyarchaeota archaeon]
MATKRRAVTRMAKKSGKKLRQAKTRKAGRSRKKVEVKKYPPVLTPVVLPPLGVERPIRERSRITVENIRGDTAIGDLLVTFPRTREILVRKGLRLEAEDAGDIYMTLDAFSAMNGLKAESLVQELVEAAKEPPPQQAVTHLVAPSAA